MMLLSFLGRVAAIVEFAIVILKWSAEMFQFDFLLLLTLFAHRPPASQSTKLLGYQ